MSLAAIYISAAAMHISTAAIYISTVAIYRNHGTKLVQNGRKRLRISARRSGAARLHGSAVPLGAWFAVATHRRLGTRCEKCLPRRSVDGERARLDRYR